MIPPSRRPGFFTRRGRHGPILRAWSGVDRDVTQRTNWYRRAALHGNPLGQWALGNFYQFGDGVDKNMEQARHWYERAAGQGFVFAEVRLGLLYEHGDGVPRDYAELLHWFQLAANAGNVVALTASACSIDAVSECRKTMGKPCSCSDKPPTRAPLWPTTTSDYLRKWAWGEDQQAGGARLVREGSSGGQSTGDRSVGPTEGIRLHRKFR